MINANASEATWASGITKRRISRMPIMRVCLETADSDYDAEWNITLDLMLSEDGRPSSRMTSFGVRGGMAKKSSCIEPFLLFADGRVDFGTDFNDDTRELKTNFFSGKAIAVGEYFTVGDEEETVTYRVTKIIERI